MGLKRKASANNVLSPSPESSSAKRKTRSTGPAEHHIPLYQAINEKERKAKEKKTKEKRVNEKEPTRERDEGLKEVSVPQRRSLSLSSSKQDESNVDQLLDDDDDEEEEEEEEHSSFLPNGGGEADEEGEESDELNLKSEPQPTLGRLSSSSAASTTATPAKGRSLPKIIADRRNSSSPTKMDISPSKRHPTSSNTPTRTNKSYDRIRPSPATQTPTKQRLFISAVEIPPIMPSSPFLKRNGDASHSRSPHAAGRSSPPKPPPITVLSDTSSRLSTKSDRKGKQKAVPQDDEEEDDELLLHESNHTPSKPPTLSPAVDKNPFRPLSPTKSSPSNKSRPTSPTKTNKFSKFIPEEWVPFLEAQKRAVLANLVDPPGRMFDTLGGSDKDGVPTKQEMPVDTLTSLLKGTTERGEGNSCLVLGPRGCGKTRIVEQAITNVMVSSPTSKLEPIVVRLSAEVQTNDKLAMREMARQLVKQTGGSFVLPLENEEELNMDHDGNDVSASMIAASHLPSLIGTLTTLPRPTVIILDAFDLFTNHARQALLYCLFDTVQSCTAGATRSKTGDDFGAGGVAVIGITTRVDCLNLMEKRVKSRFSGRLVRVGVVQSFEDYVTIARGLLIDGYQEKNGDVEEDEDEIGWRELWAENVESFLSHKDITRLLRETFSLTKDVRTLCRMLTEVVLRLSSISPWLQPDVFVARAMNQVAPPKFTFIKDLPYPALALLVATFHISNKGHDIFNFEILWATFSKQVDRTAAMPVMLDGASVGMIKVARNVMFGAFEKLVGLRVFEHSGPISSTVAKQFAKYRCAIERYEIQEAVEKQGNTRLKHWLKRPSE